MNYEMYQKGSYHIISIKEVIHMASDISQLEHIVNEILEKGSKNIAIRFQDESYIYSGTGFVFIRCLDKIRENNGILAFINVNPEIHAFLTTLFSESDIVIYGSDEELKPEEV